VSSGLNGARIAGTRQEDARATSMPSQILWDIEHDVQLPIQLRKRAKARRAVGTSATAVLFIQSYCNLKLRSWRYSSKRRGESEDHPLRTSQGCQSS